MSDCSDKLLVATTSAFSLVIVFYICLYFYLILKGLFSSAASTPIKIPSWLNVSVPSWLVSKGTKGGGFGPDPFWGPMTLTTNENKCWDVSGGPKATKSGTKINIWDCNKATNQSFYYDYDKSSLRVKNSNKCVDVPKNNRKNGEKLQIWDCNGGASQKWIPSGDSYQLEGSNLCIDLPNGNSKNGNPLQIYDCNDGDAQNWYHSRPN